jgi:hypothetical protein
LTDTEADLSPPLASTAVVEDTDAGSAATGSEAVVEVDVTGSVALVDVLTLPLSEPAEICRRMTTRQMMHCDAVIGGHHMRRV